MSTQNDRWLRSLICFFGFLTLTACGFVDNAGDGVNQPPTVTTGDDQVVAEQSLVTMTSSVVDDFDNIKNIEWRQLNGIQVALTGADTPTAQFVAPVVSLADGPQVLTFVLAATDNFDEQVEGTVKITVNPVNASPVANDDTLSTSEDTPNTVNLVANDHDNVDGTIDPSTIQIVSQPKYGDVDVHADGTLTYRPSLNYFGTDDFGYTVQDNETATSNVAQVYVTVAAVNDPPVALPGSLSVTEDTAGTGNLSAIDPDGGVTFSVASLPSKGSVVVNNPTTGAYTYTPFANENGADSFAFRASDGDLESTATVAITINPVNDAPVVAPGQMFSINELSPNGSVVGTVVATDPDGDATITGFAITGGNTGGAFAIGSTGVLTVNASEALNFDTNPIFNLSVAATDGVVTSVAATVVINLNELPNVSISASPKILVEGQSSAVAVLLDKSVGFDVDVTFGFSGSATFDVDYTLGGAIIPQTGIVTVTAGTTRADFSVATIDGDTSEPSGEDVVIAIVGVTNGVEQGVQQQRLSIFDGENCSDLLNRGQSGGSGVYRVPVDISNPPTVMDIYCDMVTAGGGWTLVLNYVHQGNTNPPLNIKNADLPLMGSLTRGADESNDKSLWGHASNALLSAFDFSELRFYGESSGHIRIVHFSTDHAETLDYVRSGNGSMSGFTASLVDLGVNNPSLPLGASAFTSNRGNLALTDAPFYIDGMAYWNIGGEGIRWEVDDSAVNFSNDTLHRVWIR